MITVNPDGTYTIADPRLEETFGPAQQRGARFEQKHFDIAHSLQVALQHKVLQMARWLHRQVPVDALCLAGGVALNCVLNAYIRDRGPFKQIWIQPAAGDAGTALGAALWVDMQERRRDGDPAHRTHDFVMKHAYLGPEFSDEEIYEFLCYARANFREMDCIHEDVAALLVQDKVVGWFQGRMEFGPRALGSRSIIASPLNASMHNLRKLALEHRAEVAQARVDKATAALRASEAPLSQGRQKVQKGAPVPYSATTPYLNTIPPGSQDRLSPRELAIDYRIRSLIRWNALAIVLRANAESSELGGHIASFQSAATFYDVGFHHVSEPTDQHGGHPRLFRVIRRQGLRPLIRGRAALRGAADKFRQEIDGGISSYPHPWLMPDYWHPGVDGPGPDQAIYQARFLKYLSCRGLAGTRIAKCGLSSATAKPTSRSRWAQSGWQPRAARQPHLRDQLQPAAPRRAGTRQRQNHPGARGAFPPRRLERDQGHLGHRVGRADRAGHHRAAAQADGGSRRRRVPGLQVRDGAYVREKFFGKYPELLDGVAGMTDAEIGRWTGAATTGEGPRGVRRRGAGTRASRR